MRPYHEADGITLYCGEWQAVLPTLAHFDVVVTDLSMPEMSGRDLARGLLQIRPDVPIVLTSGYVRSEDVESAKQLGIRDVLLKPNTVEDLGKVLHALLGGLERRGG